jgi:hypothetical protein
MTPIPAPIDSGTPWPSRVPCGVSMGFFSAEKPVRPSRTCKKLCFSKSAETRVPAGQVIISLSPILLASIVLYLYGLCVVFLNFE